MKRYHLNKIKIGSKITFLKEKPGVVVDIWSTVHSSNLSDVEEMRLRIKHNGSESYHTYRHDGKSTNNYTHDMLSIDGERLK